MNDVDEIFRSGLDGKGMPYEESEWAAMEGLIAGQKRSALLRRLWIGLGTGVALVFLIGALWQNDRFESGTQQAQGPSQAQVSEHGTEKALDNPEPHASAEVQTLQSNTNSENAEGPLELNTEVVESPQTSSRTTVQPPTSAAGTATSTTQQSPVWATAQTSSEGKETIGENDGNGLIKSDIGAFSLLPLFNLNLVPTVMTNITERAKELNQSLFVLNQQTGEWQWMLEPFYSFGTFEKSFSGLGVEGHSLKEAETAKGVSNWGINLRAQKGRLSLFGGAGQIRVLESTNYPSYTAQWSYDTSIVMVKKNYGNTKRGTVVALMQEQIDSTRVDDLVSYNCANCETQMTHTRIPLGLQYHVPNGRTELFVRVGAEFWLTRSVSGDYTVKEELLEVRSLRTEDLEARVAFYNYALGLNFKLNQSLSAWTTVGQSRGLQSMIRSYEQKLVITQLGFGLSYSLLR